MLFLRRSILVLSILFSSTVLFVSCQSEIANEPEPTVVPPVPTEIIAKIEPTDLPPTAIPELVDECLDCHLDKDRLIVTAKEEVILESENDGEG